MKMGSANKLSFTCLLLSSAVLLSIAATYAQIDYLGVHFIRVQQAKMHQEMLQGIAGNPWQYRILADLLIEPIIALSRRLGFSSPEALSFIAFRLLQNLLILVTAGIYYRKLGLPLQVNLLALSILTWGMSFSLYNSDLSFNVYFDVAFYLLAGILILEGRLLWVVLLMLPAAFNRETSLLIPLLLVGLYLFDETRRSNRAGAIRAAAAAIAVYVIVAVGLRLHYGHQDFLTADGYYPGLGLLWLNATRLVTWEQLLITLGIMPPLAILVYPSWPRVLRIFFWVCVPIWVGVHFVSALVAETRLMLVPQTIIFIPAALSGLAASRPPAHTQGAARSKLAPEGSPPLPLE